MDSLTQIILGAGVGAAVGGRKYGRKSALIGGICGLIPDLDVLFLDSDYPVKTLTEHRGLSHSLLFSIIATPILAWGFSLIKWFKAGFKDTVLHAIIFLGLITHILLDAMTIYGTQIFWPSPMEPIGLGSIFIIDPLYTFPFLFFLVWFLINKSHKAILTGLIISSLYLAWSVGAQSHVTQIAEKELSGTNYSQTLIQPTPFNTILWRVLVIKDSSYEVGYYSLFDESKNIQFKTFDNSRTLLNKIEETDDVKRLKWFMKGFYSIKQQGNDIIISDLRMGLEPDNYVFTYKIGEIRNNNVIAVPVVKTKNQGRSLERLKLVWHRIWNSNIDL